MTRWSNHVIRHEVLRPDSFHTRRRLHQSTVQAKPCRLFPRGPGLRSEGCSGARKQLSHFTKLTNCPRVQTKTQPKFHCISLWDHFRVTVRIGTHLANTTKRFHDHFHKPTWLSSTALLCMCYVSMLGFKYSLCEWSELVAELCTGFFFFFFIYMFVKVVAQYHCDK